MADAVLHATLFILVCTFWLAVIQIAGLPWTFGALPIVGYLYIALTGHVFYSIAILVTGWAWVAVAILFTLAGVVYTRALLPYRLSRGSPARLMLLPPVLALEILASASLLAGFDGWSLIQNFVSVIWPGILAYSVSPLVFGICSSCIVTGGGSGAALLRFFNALGPAIDTGDAPDRVLTSLVGGAATGILLLAVFFVPVRLPLIGVVLGLVGGISMLIGIGIAGASTRIA